MTKNERNHEAMLVNTDEVIGQNADKFQPSSAYEPAKSNLDESIATIKSLGNTQDELQHASAAPRNSAREAASMPIFQLSNVIASFAYATGNISLAEKVKITLSDLKRLPDGDLVTRFTTILNTGNEYASALIEYGVTEEILTSDNELFNVYKVEIQKQALRVLELKEVTKQLKQEFKVADNCLKPFDKMVEAKRVSDPVWYSLYQSARIIKRSPASRVSAKGKVFDAVTNQPLTGAVLTVSKVENGKAFTSGPDLSKIVKIKSAGGGFDMKSLPTGAYLFTVSYAGYADQQTTVYINEGVLTRVELPLSRIA
jgi:hypothetical protein